MYVYPAIILVYDYMTFLILVKVKVNFFFILDKDSQIIFCISLRIRCFTRRVKVEMKQFICTIGKDFKKRTEDS